MARIDWESGDFVDHNALNQMGVDINAAEESEEIMDLQSSKQKVIPRATVTTAASTAGKVTALPNSLYVPVAGDLFIIEFTNGNSASNPTLSINSSPPLPIVGASGGTSSTNTSIAAGVEVLVLHDTDKYRLLTGNQTVYSSFTAAELQTGTSTSGRIVTPALLAANFLTLAPQVPSSPINSGRTGQYALSDTYLYVCVATNTWRRTPLSSW